MHFPRRLPTAQLSFSGGAPMYGNVLGTKEVEVRQLQPKVRRGLRTLFA